MIFKESRNSWELLPSSSSKGLIILVFISSPDFERVFSIKVLSAFAFDGSLGRIAFRILTSSVDILLWDTSYVNLSISSYIDILSVGSVGRIGFTSNKMFLMVSTLSDEPILLWYSFRVDFKKSCFGSLSLSMI
jgi:hypothetical protein